MAIRRLITISVIALLVVFLPSLMVIAGQPIVSIGNESIAWLGWCLFVIFSSVIKKFRWFICLRKPEAAPIWILCILFIFAVVGVAQGRHPYPFSILIYLAYLILAALVFLAAFNLADAGKDFLYFVQIFSAIWALSALVGVGVGFYQYFNNNGFLPFIAALRDPGRIYGNLRQPNLYATFLCCAIPLMSWLAIERRQINIYIFYVSLFFLSIGIAMSGSRTGMISLMLMGFFLFRIYRGLFLGWRLIFLLLPVFYLCAVLIFSWLSEVKLYPYFALDRIRSIEGNITGSRIDMWITTLEMIKAYPLFGVGVDRFTFFYLLGNWTNQGVLRFEHTHNIFLQWAVENGVIAMTLILSGLVCYFHAIFRVQKTPIVFLAIAFLCPLAVHSFFEFPLWYSFYLFPCMFFLGFISHAISGRPTLDGYFDVKIIALISSALFCACLLVFVSHQKLDQMYQKSEKAIDARVLSAQQSLFFRQHVDHALLITFSPDIAYSSLTQSIYQSTAQVLVDDRLIYQWAIQSLLNKKVEEAKKLAYSLSYMNPELFEELRVRSRKVTMVEVPQINDFLAFLDNPKPVDISPEDLLKP